jgi:hypothetical protein
VPYAPNSMFTRYRTVLTHSGAWRFSLTALVARLPISISTLGIVLLVTGLGRPTAWPAPSRRRSPSRTGCRPWSRAACWTGSDSRSCSPSWPRCTPSGWSTGHRPGGGWPEPVAFAAAFLAGAAYPPIGSAVRARWSHVLPRPPGGRADGVRPGVGDRRGHLHHRPDRRDRAGHPVASVGGPRLALVTGVPGTLALAAQRGSQPIPPPGLAALAARPAMPWAPVVILAAVLVRPRLHVRRRRGQHGRLLLRAARQVVRRGPAGLLVGGAACWPA